MRIPNFNNCTVMYGVVEYSPYSERLGGERFYTKAEAFASYAQADIEALVKAGQSEAEVAQFGYENDNVRRDRLERELLPYSEVGYGTARVVERDGEIIFCTVEVQKYRVGELVFNTRDECIEWIQDTCCGEFDEHPEIVSVTYMSPFCSRDYD